MRFARLTLASALAASLLALAVAFPASAQDEGGDPNAFIMPYESYTLTQGSHGQSYGHDAIDLSAGNGAPIRSPIYGEVTALYTDGLGNPVLVLENSRFTVTLMHGVYTVQLGDRVRLGDQVGTESNLGYTGGFDSAGNWFSCRNQNCGYHTHLNVFDKQEGKNVDPLGLVNTEVKPQSSVGAQSLNLGTSSWYALAAMLVITLLLVGTPFGRRWTLETGQSIINALIWGPGKIWEAIKSGYKLGCLFGAISITGFAILVIVLMAKGVVTVQLSARPSPVATSDLKICSQNLAIPDNVRRWCYLIVPHAAREGLDPLLVAADLQVESNGDPVAISYCDATGLMQVMPRDLTRKTIACGAYAERIVKLPNDQQVVERYHVFADRPLQSQLLDPETNVFWGTKEMGWRVRLYGERDGLVLYGPTGVGYAYADQVLVVRQTYQVWWTAAQGDVP